MTITTTEFAKSSSTGLVAEITATVQPAAKVMTALTFAPRGGLTVEAIAAETRLALDAAQRAADWLLIEGFACKSPCGVYFACPEEVLAIKPRGHIN